MGSVFGSFLGLGSADALVVELQNVGVMYETIDSGHGGERVLEDLVPFAEGEIARQQHTAAQAAHMRTARARHLAQLVPGPLFF